MKKMFFMIILLTMPLAEALAWGKLGHDVVVAVAQRHLTKQTKENLAKYFPGDLKDESVWMDEHRRDADIAFTTNWHSCAVDKNFKYDPNPPKRMKNGDAVRALRIVDDNFRNYGYKDMADSLVKFNLRMLLHFVGDIHCPTHNRINGVRAVGKRTLNGKEYGLFHSVYDVMPELIWADTKADDIAAKIDNASRKERRQVVSGDIHDWVTDLAKRNFEIYTWNPITVTVLRDDTVEISTELVNLQMRNAGYRLACLLNLYFGK